MYVKCHLVLFFITTKYHQNIQRVFDLHSYSKGSLTYSVDTMLMSNITKGDNAKRMVELSFLYATCRLVLLYISTQYHQNIPKGLWLTEWTRNQWINTVRQREITPKERKAELSLLYITCRLVLFYISTKYHKNIPQGLWLTEQIRNQWIITVKYNKAR